MIVPWPESWPVYKQGCFGSWSDCCDTLVGPCRCGASHAKGEFTFRSGVLRRYGERVPTADLRISDLTSKVTVTEQGRVEVRL